MTQHELKRKLLYNQTTGNFVRLEAAGRAKAGAVAGYVNNRGYICIGINGREHRAHRLAFLYMTGSFPEDQVDHINQIKEDNRWLNLRCATRSQNLANTKKMKTNTSGYKGVSWKKKNKKWGVKICFQNKQVHLGYFESLEDAALAYNKKALELFGEFAKLNVF